MEIYKTSFRGYSVSVIFNGGKYFFYSDYAGLFAIATRDTSAYGQDFDKRQARFALEYGNENLNGGSLQAAGAVPAVKRFIAKNESRYIPTKVVYTSETYADLSMKHLKVEAV